MREARERFLETVLEYRFNPDEPGSGQYWAPALDTISRSQLREIQSEKLVAAVRYMYECSPFYRAKFDALKLTSADIKSIDDLWKIPITTKQQMAQDVIAHPPWGTYSPIDDEVWSRRGWMLFTSSGTTAQSRPFRYTLFDRDLWAWSDARSLWAMGVRPGDKAFLAFGYGPFAAFWGFQHGFNRIGDFATFTEERCACGMTHVRAIGGFQGRADDMLNIRGLTVFPSAVEEVVRHIDELGDEFEVVVYQEQDLDCLRIVAEPRAELSVTQQAALAEKIESEIRAKIGLRPGVELRAPGSLPKTELKARRLRDLRPADRR